MDGRRIAYISDIVRNFLFRLLNKEFLIFLFFLLLSGSFWLAMTLNETYEKEVMIPLRLVDVPRNVVLTSDVDDTLSVVVRDKGYSLMAYIYGDKLRRVDIPYKSYAKKSGTGVVTAAELQKMIYKMLFSSSRIVNIKPNKFEFFYNYGQKKLVSVKIYGRVAAARSHYLESIELSPHRVEVYGSQEVLDTINFAYTERMDLANLTDTLTRIVRLNKIKGVKFVPDVVRMSVFSDVLTEESVEIPVTAVNMPEGNVLRTFPSRVKITFTVGSKMFRKIRAEKFKVTADYNEIKKHPSDKCAIHITSVPEEVRDARMDITQVDYLIEEK